jgi:hypothetical protein
LKQSIAQEDTLVSDEEERATILTCPERKPTSLESRTEFGFTQARRVVLRPFKNTMPYDVVIYANSEQVGRIHGCSESQLVIPAGNLRLQAFLSVPEEGGQRQVEARLELNDRRTGWRVSWPEALRPVEVMNSRR